MKFKSPFDGSTIEVPDGTSKPDMIEHMVNIGNVSQEKAIQFAKDKGIEYNPNYAQNVPSHFFGIPSFALEGVTAGHGAEVPAGIQSIAQEIGESLGGEEKTVKERFSENLDDIRRNMNLYEGSYRPMAATAEFGSMLAPATAGVKLAGGASKGIPKLLKEMGAAGLIGGAAYHGSLDGEKLDTGDLITQSALTSVFPPLMHGLAGAAKLLPTGKNNSVYDFLKMVQEKSGKPISKISEELTPDSSVMNVTGKAGETAAKVLGSTTADAARIVERNVGEQLAGSTNRIKKELRNATSKKEYGYHDNLSTLIRARKENAAKNYGESLSKPVFIDKDDIDLIVGEPLYQMAWNRVASKHRNIMKELVPGTGNLDEFSLMDGRLLQEFKWELDKIIDTYSKSTSASQNTLARYARERKKELIDVIDEKLPGFRKSNSIYAGDSAMIQAQELGKKSGLGRKNIDDQLKEIRDLNESEKDAYLSGIMSDVYDKIGKRSEDAIPNLNSLKSANSRKVLNELLGEKDADRIINRIEMESGFIDQKGVIPKEIAEVRETAREMSEGFGKDAGTARNVVGYAADLHYKRAGLYRIGQVLFGRPRLKDSEISEVTDLLTNPKRRNEAIKVLRDNGYSQKTINAIIDNLATVGSGVGITEFLSGSN